MLFDRHCIIAVFLFTVLLGGALWLVPTYQEYKRTRQVLRDTRAEAFEKQVDNEKLRTDIHLLRTDPRERERVARDKFLWCAPNEKIYEFQD